MINMSHYWTFSYTSNSILQQCLDAAAQPDPHNKWLLAFGARNKDLTERHNTVIVLNDSPDVEDAITSEITVDTGPIPTFDDTIDLVSRFVVIQEECIKSPKRLLDLAQNLPINTIEDFSRQIFESKDVKHDFLVLFFEHFIPSFVKRDNSRYCTDILLNTYKIYPQYFKIVLQGLIKDVELQNNVLQDFILSLDPDGLTKFLVNLSYIELTAEEFVHNVFIIYTAYKTSNKTDVIQNFIFSCLKNYSEACVIDKNYGRMMLTYLQHEKSVENKVHMFSKLLETHKSAFVRPCMAIYKDLCDSISPV